MLGHVAVHTTPARLAPAARLNKWHQVGLDALEQVTRASTVIRVELEHLTHELRTVKEERDSLNSRVQSLSKF